MPNTTTATPIGNRVVKSIGPGNLKPKAGTEARKTDIRVYCGRMVGRIFTVKQAPNRKDPTRTSNAFIGAFLAIKADGEAVKCHECYLPGVVDSSYAEMAKRLDTSAEIRFAFEIWAEPDEGSPVGYRYVVYDILPATTSDPLMELAALAGMIEAPPPAPELAAPEIRDTPAPEYDPDTGEVMEVEVQTGAPADPHTKRARRAA